MASTFLTVADFLTWAGFFILLAIVCLLVGAFFYFVVPETKGRSLEDMTLYFAEITNDRAMLGIEMHERNNNTNSDKRYNESTSEAQTPPDGIVSSGTMA